MGRRKNPFSLLREQIRLLSRKAYYSDRIRDADAQATYIWKDCTAFNSGKNKITTKLAVFYMIKLVVNSKWRADFEEEERDLFGLAMTRLQSEFPVIDEQGNTVMMAKRLGDWQIAEIAITRERKKANIKAALNEQARWERAASFIEPLLEEHADWTWSDAVNYARDKGSLPELGE